MGEQVVIDRRFRGPPDSANGGYACGVVAQFVEASPTTVRLRLPPPLDVPLDVERAHEVVRLLSGEDVVAEGRAAAPLDLAPPEPPTLDEARGSSVKLSSEDHAFPTCFVCGPDRRPPDGLGIYAGPVAGRDDGVIATTWTPVSDLADADGSVDDVFIWSVLDCPTGNAAFSRWVGNGWSRTRMVLGELTGSIDGPVLAGEEHVIIAWPLERDGRKHYSAMAIARRSGEIVARSKATWITVN